MKPEIQNNPIGNIKDIENSYNESTGLSWLWALLFGPLYFAVYGFWGRAFILIILNFFIIGIVIAPFMVYPAWRERARKEAERTIKLNAALNR